MRVENDLAVRSVLPGGWLSAVTEETSVRLTAAWVPEGGLVDLAHPWHRLASTECING
jgi:hypothetical protein